MEFSLGLAFCCSYFVTPVVVYQLDLKGHIIALVNVKKHLKPFNVMLIAFLDVKIEKCTLPITETFSI